MTRLLVGPGTTTAAANQLCQQLKTESFDFLALFVCSAGFNRLWVAKRVHWHFSARYVWY